MTLPNWWLKKATASAYDDVMYCDFEHDSVLLFGWDVYESGFNHGLLVGAVICGGIISGYHVVKRIKERKGIR